MRRNLFKLLLLSGLCVLVVSGIGPTLAIIESATGINTHPYTIQPTDLTPNIMEQIFPWYDQVTYSSLPKQPGTGFYLEDFSTTTFLGVSETNTSGWGSGFLTLPNINPTFVGAYDTPGLAINVFVDGDYAYIADWSSGMQVINITEPSKPDIVGVYSTPTNAWDVFVSGDIAYVTDRNYLLRVCNITDPTHPSHVANCGTTDNIEDVYISGNYAYIAERSIGLRIINITDPVHPQSLAICDTPNYARGVVVEGNYAYIADDTSGLQVVNITNPGNPFLVGSWNTPSSACDVFISGDYAYVADGYSGLQVVNIADPTNPTIAGSCDTPGYSWDVSISGNCAYIADLNSGLQVLNVTDPTNPMLVGTCDTPGNARGLFVSGEHAFLADNEAGLQIIKIADYTSPSYVGSYNTPGTARGVFVSGDYAYIADEDSGLQVINITIPSQPSLVGTYNTPGGAFGVFVSGDYAYIADHSSGLQVINVTVPSQPSLAGTYDTPGHALSVFVSGDYAYIADYYYGLEVVNVTVPSQPTLAGSYDTPGIAYGVFVCGDYAYIADHDSGLQVINITVPSQPTLAGSYDTPGTALGVFVCGDFAYIADSTYGLQVINITIPSQPFLAGSYNTPDYAWDVFVSGDYAYIADYDSGLTVVNVTVPSQPTLAGSYDTPGIAYGVFVCGDYAYMADGSSSLQVVEVQWSRCRQFESMAVAQSLPVFDALSSSVVRATLSLLHSVPSNTQIEYYLSADSGTHWEQVIPDVEHTFSFPGKQLRWKGVLTTSNPLITPSISVVIVHYVTILDAPILLAPNDGISINDNTPTFEWEMVSAAESYLLQLDRVASFDSVDLINTTVVALTYTPSSPLVDGVWFWRIVAQDIDGDWGVFSSTRSLDIETGLPVWDQVPTSQVFEFGMPFRYDLNASDPSGLDQWWIDDTSHFAIDGTGVITNTTRLSVDLYGLQVWVNDTYNNILTGIFMVTVQDTTAPMWDQTPTHQNITVGERFRYDLNASDLSGIHSYWINDTTHFTIDGNGLIYDAQDLTIGIYWLEVRAYDPYNLYCEAIFNVTVSGVIPDTQPPTWVTAPTDQTLEYGEMLDYQLAASDLSGLDTWWLNDTTNFNIGSNGRITSIGILTQGVFGVRVWVNDTYDNVLTGTFNVLVEDTISPTWVQMPTSQALEVGDIFFYDVDAFDLSGIDHYWINDTHFAINENGGISNATTLAAGIYRLEVRAYDPYNHYCSATFIVTVQEATPTPTPTTLPPWMIPAIATGSFIGGAAFIGVAAYIILRRKKKSL